MVLNYAQDLYLYNPWWGGKFPDERNWPKRNAFKNIEALLDLRQIVSLVGLRRVGKTTILKQIIDSLISGKKVKPENILFIQFDEEIVINSEKILDEVIKFFITRISNQEIINIKDKIYIFLDEIQNITNWQILLKKYYDLFPNIKFFISGSSSLFIEKKSKESLAGRIFEETIWPLDFNEFLEIKGLDFYKLNIFNSFKKYENFSEELINENYKEFLKLKDNIIPLFEEYILYGQFPEIINFSDERLKYRYLKNSVLKKVLEYDLVKHFKMLDTSLNSNLFNILASESGSLLEFQNIARELGINKDLITTYYDIFEKANLAKIIYNYCRSARKSRRQLKKAYVSSPNFSACMDNISIETLGSHRLLGSLAETHALMQLRKNYEDLNFLNIRQDEIDFIVKAKGEIIPLEVKYRDSIKFFDLKSMIKLCEKIKVKEGVVITKNILKKEIINSMNIFYVPIWLI